MTPEKILVTKSFIPPFAEYSNYLKEVFESAWLTNNGKFVVDLEKRLREKLGVKNFLYCSNGTVVLELAIRALCTNAAAASTQPHKSAHGDSLREHQMEIITTPYSYVATTNSILWMNCKPVFVDINESDFNINPALIEAAINENTKAILATHVYGNPCDTNAIAAIANKYNLKIIYDAAHAFGVNYQGKSLLSYGDISTCSFHATKVFHTVEGGCLIAKDDQLFDKIYKTRQFGHIYDEYFLPGTNAKNSEIHAIMGHCVLNHFDEIVNERKTISSWYDSMLNHKKLKRPIALKETEYNYAYYPIIFDDEKTCLKVKSELEKENIFARRYFYPALNTLPFVDYKKCEMAETIAVSVLSLPLYVGLNKINVEKICRIINFNL